MRAFIAIETPEEISKTLEEIQKRFKDAGKINFTKPPYHLTLKFLGDISEEQAEKIMSLLRNIKIRPFELGLSELGVFPNESYIRVLWVGVKDDSKVNELQQQIDSKLTGLFEKDPRFHVHITLGRVKFVKDKEKIKELLKTKIPALKFEVKEFKLIKSELTPKGPEYKDLEVFG